MSYGSCGFPGNDILDVRLSVGVGVQPFATDEPPLSGLHKNFPSDRGAYTNPQIKLRSPSELEPVLFSLYSLSFPSDQGPLINGIALRPGHTAFDTQKIYSK